MGCAASVSMGNKTESNVTNSTSNEQYFSMENIVKITNSMNQKTVNVQAISHQLNQQTDNEASVEIEGGTWNIGGEGQTTTFSANATSEQKAELIADATAVTEHTANLTDAVMFDIANNGFSQQSSDMSSSATASSTTELEVSGIGTAAASVGINNTVCTNVNNSIRNVFNMAVNNNMSSATDRALLAESVNDAVALVNQVNSNTAGIKIKNLNLNISGKDNTTEITADVLSGMAATLQEKLTSNLKSSLTAITNTVASATSTVEASQTAKSSATASASQSQSTKVSTDGTIWAVAGVVMVVAGCVAAIGVAKCKSKGNQQNGIRSEEQPLLQP